MSDKADVPVLAVIARGLICDRCAEPMGADAWEVGNGHHCGGRIVDKASNDGLCRQLAGAVEDLLTFAHTVLDTPCPYGREGDPWAASQRRARELITAYGGQSEA